MSWRTGSPRQLPKWFFALTTSSRGEPPPPETTEPSEMLRCEICNCTVPNGVNGMKIHREGKRHQGMVQLMRL